MQLWNSRRRPEVLASTIVLIFLQCADLPAQGSKATARNLAGANRTENAAMAAARVLLKQPEFLEQYALTNRFSNGRPAGIQITRGGDAVLFLRSEARSFRRNLYEFNVATGAERVLATAARLLGGAQEKLSVEEKARRERMRLSAGGIAAFELSPDGRTVLVPLSGKLYLIERPTGAVRQLTSKAGEPIDPRFSPDGKQVACVREGDLYVTEIASGNERPFDVRGDRHADPRVGRVRGPGGNGPHARLLVVSR